MEGERVLLKENPLSLQTSLTPENFPHVPATYEAKSCFAFREWREHGGSFFVGLGGADLLQGAAIALFLWVGYVSRVYLAQPLTSNIHPMRNDPRVVPLNHHLTSYHFYPVAERAQAHKSRSTGFGSEQPEFAARNTATPKSAPTKRKREKPLCYEGLEGS